MDELNLLLLHNPHIKRVISKTSSNCHYIKNFSPIDIYSTKCYPSYQNKFFSTYARSDLMTLDINLYASKL